MNVDERFTSPGPSTNAGFEITMSFPSATPASATCSPSCFVMGYGSDFATSGNS